MVLSKKMKIGLGVFVLVIIMFLGGFLFSQSKLSVSKIKEVKPFYFVNDNTLINASKYIETDFTISDDFESKKEALNYYVYNNADDTLTELNLDAKNEIEYKIDIESIANKIIYDYLETGDLKGVDTDTAGGMICKFTELLDNNLDDYYLYLIALPKNDDLNKKIGQVESNDLEEVVENTYFDKINFTSFLFNAQNNKNSNFGGYETVSEYICGEVIKEMSATDFDDLMKLSNYNIPRPIEIIDSYVVEDSGYKTIDEEYGIKGYYNTRQAKYTLKGDFAVETFGYRKSYLTHYDVPSEYRNVLSDKINEWDKEIEEDKIEYEKDKNSKFTDSNIQEIGKVDNAMFKLISNGQSYLVTKGYNQ